MEARTMYPHLTSEQILAAHSYAKAHVEEIANDIREQSEGPPEPTCHHGVTFDQKAAEGMSANEVRERWPRGWFTVQQPCGCGFVGIAYASTAHYLCGDW